MKQNIRCLACLSRKGSSWGAECPDCCWVGCDLTMCPDWSQWKGKIHLPSFGDKVVLFGTKQKLKHDDRYSKFYTHWPHDVESNAIQYNWSAMNFSLYIFSFSLTLSEKWSVVGQMYYKWSSWWVYCILVAKSDIERLLDLNFHTITREMLVG